MPVRRTVDQDRAREAWLAVQTVAQRDPKLQGEYRALARGFASMIQLNGLGPACAFLFAKAGASKAKLAGAHALLLDHLQAWLRQHFPMAEAQSLIDWLTNPSTSVEGYRRATVEVLAYLLWLRRFAEGALAAPERPGDDIR